VKMSRAPLMAVALFGLGAIGGCGDGGARLQSAVPEVLASASGSSASSASPATTTVSTPDATASMTPTTAVTSTTSTQSASSTAASSSAALPSGQPSQCPSSALALEQLREGAYLGRATQRITVRNVSSSACQLTDQLTITGTSASGAQTAIDAVPDPERVPYLLPAGQLASVVVSTIGSCAGAAYGKHPSREFTSFQVRTTEALTYSFPGVTFSDYCGDVRISTWSSAGGQ